MNFSQKLGLSVLIIISAAYVYFSFFADNTPNQDKVNNTIEQIETNGEESAIPPKARNVKIFISDSNGKLCSVNRVCTENGSCFEFAMKELMLAPSKEEKSKGFTSEIPAGTKILSIREGESSVMIDLSSAFESGGGTESTYKKMYQIIKTANANTRLPVYLYIDGKQADVIGGEGLMIKQPLNERSLDD